ncbi:MAG: proline--tRNA ligase [Rickettsiales bacterium]|jgi:prolyl-tRNA synthetase|nr:proline--tRNA ligase [Rickettsiales bacterium]
MRLEKLLIRTLREAPESAETLGHQFSVRGGYVHQTGAGVYTISPLGLRVLKNIETIMGREMNKLGCQEVLMPVVSPASLWIESNRYDSVDALLKFKTRGGINSVLNPTHEEIICDYVRSFLQSYRQLPFALYQMQTKYRDELRVRAGLIRCREFIMKDAYSFHSSDGSLEEFYGEMLKAYHLIYKKVGLVDIIEVVAPVGDMGGRVSHEFQMISPMGEDKIYICASCEYKCNSEALENSGGNGENVLCPKCGKKLREARGVEIGNIFQLGTKYSESMSVFYSDETGGRRNPVMGCYGIGISRTMASIMEQRLAADANGAVWNMLVAPYRVHIMTIGNSENIMLTSSKIYHGLCSLGIDTILDDGEEGAGSKFANSDLIAAPIVVIISNRCLSMGNVELKYGNVKGDYPTSIPVADICEKLGQFIENELALLER